jgi:hypothetical protein
MPPLPPLSRKLLLSLALTAACSASRVAAPPASSSEGEGTELDDFDPAREVEQQPFESVNGLRGPALAINGLRLVGAGGSVLLMISAYDEGSDIVFQFLPREEAPPDWLAACPRAADPEDPRIEVALQGVGDLSHNVLVQPDFGWSTSLGLAEYSGLDTLRFEICGASYVLEDTYRERLVEHARLASERAAAASTGAAAPAAQQSR